MRQSKRSSNLLIGMSLLGTVALTGCGGAGTIGNTSALNQPSLPGQNNGTRAADGSSAREAAPGGRVGVLVTDSPSTDYAHVWVTIHKVELLDNTEKAQTVFEDTDGVTVDLKTLRDASGARFALLGTASVAAGRPMGRARVTIGKAINVLTAKASVAQTLLIADSVARDGDGRPVLSFALDHSRDMGKGDDDLVIDFDLANFTQEKGLMLPVLREGTRDNLSASNRQEQTIFTGTVRDIAAADAGQTFTLVLKSGNSQPAQNTTGTQSSAPAQGIKVLIAPTTVLFNDDKKPSPTLAENKTVRVRGVFAPDTKRLVATQVEFVSDDRANIAILRGTVSTAPSGDTPFAVDVRQATGFVPTQESVTVVLSPDAVLRSRSGLPMDAKEFNAALAAPNTQIDLEGAYDAAQGTLTATRARIVNTTPGASHDVSITGKLSLNKNRNFLIGSATEWEGTLPPAKKGTPLTLTTATAFKSVKGEYLAPESVRKMAETSAWAKVSGITSADGTFTATRIDLLPDKPAAQTAKTLSGTDTAKPDAVKPDATKPDAAKSSAIQPDAAIDAPKSDPVPAGKVL